MNSEIAIKLHQVFFETEQLQIIKGITGEFKKGKITTIIGPSGSGKSTLFRLLNGLQSVAKGSIDIFDQSINDYDPIALRKQVGIVLQEAVMIKGNVKENLALPYSLEGKALSDDEAEYMLELVGLKKEILTRDSGDLSGGQKQKVSIARTLLNKPDILLLDEITSALDRVSLHDIEQLIQHINHQFETTIIWITHNIEQAYAIADDVWVLIDGELAAAGPIKLLEKTTNQAVREFVWGDDHS
ncbi:ABC transporter ATP-binding protein [Alkalihalobacillus pseudalcaliphilus]|uniref:ABC transporter ATP-binding protein n=1 Tax=Alkalihalobacillus pseudalcaliphilus TaxID=79884 RepID=UPI002362D864|nr:phosphate ABC transporter ATP-binding protein [Alkalihalobacillus pseudalcaliphilus]